MDDAWVAWLVIGYLAGSIPFGLLLGLARGVDIRLHGSGNVGATNAGRVLGRTWGIVCFILDLLKGMLPVLLGGVALKYVGEHDLAPIHGWKWLAIGAAAVIGHMFPVWLKFKGGKGVATGLGVVLGYFPVLTLPGLLAAVTWVVVVKATRYVSVASMSAAVSLPLFMLAWMFATGHGRSAWLPFVVVTVILAGLVVLRHRTNLKRLKAGTEPKIGERRGGGH
jgi:glycerol-3-phosphate acyltransferase PlsY